LGLSDAVDIADDQISLGRNGVPLSPVADAHGAAVLAVKIEKLRGSQVRDIESKQGGCRLPVPLILAL